MAQEYNEYLAVNVLNEQQLVSPSKAISRQTANICSGQLSLAEQGSKSTQQSCEAVSESNHIFIVLMKLKIK